MAWSRSRRSTASVRGRVRQSNPQAWHEEWRAVGAQLESRAYAALAKDHKITAGDYYLRAGIYHYNAERFITPGPEKRAQGEKAYHCWHTGIRLREPSIKLVEDALRASTAAGAIHEGVHGWPSGADGRGGKRHGQCQGDEHLFRGP